jgi:hypothetical protein
MPPPVDFSIALDRADPEEVAKLARRALGNPILQAVLASAEGYVMVLNEARQVLAGNEELLEALEPPGQQLPLGEGPGVALGCVHAGEGQGGCGTSSACGKCESALAILAGQDPSLPVVAECSLNLRRGGHFVSVDFRMKVSTLLLGCHSLTVVVFQDISSRKRQEQLESIFLHDLSNTIQSLVGWGELVADGAADPRKAARRIVDLCHRLQHEVAQQRLLHAAEHGSLAVCMESVELRILIEELRDLFLARGHAEGPHLVFAPMGPGILLRTDHDLLLRVLQNMVGNALEATPVAGTVEVRAEIDGPRLRIQVCNPGVVAEEIAARIFHRSASTKGTGRGLGTYGMKLIGEDYLGGSLGFCSNPAEGTRFTLELPLGE